MIRLVTSAQELHRTCVSYFVSWDSCMPRGNSSSLSLSFLLDFLFFLFGNLVAVMMSDLKHICNHIIRSSLSYFQVHIDQKYVVNVLESPFSCEDCETGFCPCGVQEWAEYFFVWRAHGSKVELALHTNIMSLSKVSFCFVYCQILFSTVSVSSLLCPAIVSI